MKTHLQKYFAFGLLALSMNIPAVFAQEIDANRMNRDLRVMENILSELFEAESIISSERQSGNLYFPAGTFGIRGSGVQGAHLPGYGVIFMIPNNGPSQSIVIQDGSEVSLNYSFVYTTSNEEELPEVDETSVNNRMIEFLKNYAPNIGQLNDDEQVLVIFGSQSGSQSPIIIGNGEQGQSVFGSAVVRGYSTDDNDKKAHEPLPIFSASIKKEDLNNYRSGRLDDDDFEDKVDFAKSDLKEELDLKVMSNILATALNTDENNSFKTYDRSDSFLYLDNFGALFNMDVRYRGSTSNTFGAVRRIQLGNNVDVSSEATQKYFDEVEMAYEALIENATEVIVDYGSTLSSLNSDHIILVSIDINGHILFPQLSEDRDIQIPDRLDFKVEKSVLENYERGRISREEAINQVIITEY